MDTITTQMPAVAPEACASCGAQLAGDQRYCLNCGARRGDARVPFMEILGGAGAAGAPAAAGRRPERTHSQRNLTIVASIGCLLLALGVGVLIGHGGRDRTPASSSPPQVISVAGRRRRAPRRAGGRGGGGEEGKQGEEGRVRRARPGGRLARDQQGDQEPRQAVARAVPEAVPEAAQDRGDRRQGAAQGQQARRRWRVVPELRMSMNTTIIDRIRAAPRGRVATHERGALSGGSPSFARSATRSPSASPSCTGISAA